MHFTKNKIIESINKNIVGKTFKLYGFYENNFKSIDVAMWEEGGTCEQVKDTYNFVNNKLPCWRFCDTSTKNRKYFNVAIKYEIISGKIEEAIYLYQHNKISEDELAQVAIDTIIKVNDIKIIKNNKG